MEKNVNKDIKTAKPPLGWQMTTVASLIDELNRENNIGKKKEKACLIEYKDQVWKMERIK